MRFAFALALALAGCGNHGGNGCPTGPRPAARSGFVPVLTTNSNYVIVADGDGTTQPLADAWRFDFGSCAGWQALAPSTATPSARFAYAADLDTTRNRILYIGGKDAGGNDLIDAWALDADNYKFTQLMSVGGAPVARSGRAAAYDAANDRLLLLGDTLYELDFGALDQGHWLPTFASGTPAPARSDFAFAVDPGRSLAIMFGGTLDAGGLANDLWAYDFRVDRWQSIAASGDIPTARSGARMAYDATDKLLLVFGGSDGRSDLGDLYSLQLDGNGVNGKFTKISRSGTAPPARKDFGMVVSGSLLWIFGGSGACGQLDDVWTLPLDGGSWTKVMPQSHC